MLDVVAVFGDGKACQLDRGCDALRIDKIVESPGNARGRRSGALDSGGRREECIRGAPRGRLTSASCGSTTQLRRHLPGMHRTYPMSCVSAARMTSSQASALRFGVGVRPAEEYPAATRTHKRGVFRHRDKAHRSTDRRSMIKRAASPISAEWPGGAGAEAASEDLHEIVWPSASAKEGHLRATCSINLATDRPGGWF